MEVLHRRAQGNISDDEDLGLPRSPASNSPTTADDMFPKVSEILVENVTTYVKCEYFGIWLVH